METRKIRSPSCFQVGKLEHSRPTTTLLPIERSMAQSNFTESEVMNSFQSSTAVPFRSKLLSM